MPKKPVSSAKTPLRRSLRTRILVSFLTLTSLAIVLLSALSFVVARSLLTQRMFADLSNRAASQENFLEEVLRTDRQRTSLLTARLEVRGGSIDALFQELRLEQINVLGITVFDIHGNVQASVGMESDALKTTPSATTLLPHVDRFGRWIGHDVYSPIRRQNGMMLGTLALRYDAGVLLQNFFNMASANDNTNVVLGWTSGDHLYGFARTKDEEVFIEDLGSLTYQIEHEFPLAQAVRGEEGTKRAYDREGKDALVA